MQTRGELSFARNELSSLHSSSPDRVHQCFTRAKKHLLDVTLIIDELSGLSETVLTVVLGKKDSATSTLVRVLKGQKLELDAEMVRLKAPTPKQ